MGSFLTSESVQGTSLPLEGIDDIHGGDGLPLGVFGVGDGIPDHVLKEDLEDATGLLVDEAGDPLDSSPPRQTADGGLGDALDVVTEHLDIVGILIMNNKNILKHTLRCLLAPPFPRPFPPFPRPDILEDNSNR